MNVNPETQQPSTQLDEELTDALIAICRLSDEQIARIRELMSAEQLRFVEAAVHLNLVTANEVGEALEWSQQTIARTNSHVIETALRRQQVARITTVQHSAIVKAGKDLLLLHDPDNPHCERLRALRTELLLLIGHSNRKAGVIALLSPSAGEGRSQLSAELAVAFSQLGRRTLLVEADLRRPRQHLLFGAENVSGISQCLTVGRAPQLLGVHGLPHLSLLLAGPVPRNPLELLSDGRFQRMLLGWRHVFEIVIIDTPALTTYADGLSIASYAEQALLISRANTTSHKDMKETLRRLASTNARVMGAVINNF